MSTLFGLAIAFAQVGICAFGGGLSSLPLIEYQLVTRTGWLTTAEFNQVLALSQITPGPIAINAATFVGFQQAGFWGSLISTIALISGPIVMLSIVILMLQKTSAENSTKFKSFLRPIVAGLLLLAIVSPLSATYYNGMPAVALFLSGLFLIKRFRFFRENPSAMLMLFGLTGAVFLSGV